MVLTFSRVFAIPGTLGGPATLIMTTALRLPVFMVNNVLFHRKAHFIKLHQKTQLIVLFLIIHELGVEIFVPRVFYHSLYISFLYFLLLFTDLCSPTSPRIRAWRQRKVRTSLVQDNLT